MTEKFWNAQRENQLEGLWLLSKLSASKIATEIGAGITKNAVISKVHRMGLKPRKIVTVGPKACKSQTDAPSVAKPPADRMITIAPALASAELPPQPAAPFESLKVSFADIGPFQCRWIGNEDMTAPEFCGHRTVEGKSWCDFHAKRMRPSHVVSEREAERRREHGRKLGLSRVATRRSGLDSRFRAAMPVE